MKMAVFWVVGPRKLVEVYIRFRDTCCLHRQEEAPPKRRWTTNLHGATTHKTAIFEAYTVQSAYIQGHQSVARCVNSGLGNDLFYIAWCLFFLLTARQWRRWNAHFGPCYCTCSVSILKRFSGSFRTLIMKMSSCTLFSVRKSWMV
jgi:hypothetical protein